jgi:hypothetical protein
MSGHEDGGVLSRTAERAPQPAGSWVLGPASIYSGTIFKIFLDDLCVRWNKKFKIFSELEEAGPRTQDP